MIIRREISIEVEEITMVRVCAEHAGAYCPNCGIKLKDGAAPIVKYLPLEKVATDETNAEKEEICVPLVADE